MNPTVTVDSQGFTRMTRELSRISGKTHRDVIRYEAGRVLENAMRYTGSAKADAYPRRSDDDEEDQYTIAYINTGKRGPKGREWHSDYSTSKGWTHYIMGPPWGPRPPDRPYKGQEPKPRDKGSGPMRWSNRRWAAAQRQLRPLRAEIAKREQGSKPKRKKREKLPGRGLAKQSWLHIAQSLGVTIRGVTSGIQNAIPQDGRRRQSGVGTENLNGSDFFIELENRYPFLMRGRSAKAGTGKFDGQKILTGAIKSRVTAFTTALRVGSFRDMKDRSKKYPGLFTVT